MTTAISILGIDEDDLALISVDAVWTRVEDRQTFVTGVHFPDADEVAHLFAEHMCAVVTIGLGGAHSHHIVYDVTLVRRIDQDGPPPLRLVDLNDRSEQHR